jgi:hypothetical protein
MKAHNRSIPYGNFERSPYRSARAQLPLAVTAELASKIRLLPTVGIDLFGFFRQQENKWNEKRSINVTF